MDRRGLPYPILDLLKIAISISSDDRFAQLALLKIRNSPTIISIMPHR